MLMSMCSLVAQELLLWIYKKHIYQLKRHSSILQRDIELCLSVNLYLTEIYAQKKDAYQLCILLFEPLVGFEPTTPRLQITCSDQLS